MFFYGGFGEVWNTGVVKFLIFVFFDVVDVFLSISLEVDGKGSGGFGYSIDLYFLCIVLYFYYFWWVYDFSIFI